MVDSSFVGNFCHNVSGGASTDYIRVDLGEKLMIASFYISNRAGVVIANKRLIQN